MVVLPAFSTQDSRLLVAVNSVQSYYYGSVQPRPLLPFDTKKWWEQTRQASFFVTPGMDPVAMGSKLLHSHLPSDFLVWPRGLPGQRQTVQV